MRETSAHLRRSRSGLDEGYSGESEETRSLSDTDGSMQIDTADAGGEKMALGDDTAQIHSQVLALPEHSREALMLSLLGSLSDEQRNAVIPALLANYSIEGHKGTAHRSYLIIDLLTNL